MVSSEFEPLVLAWQPEVQDLVHAMRARRRSPVEVRMIAAVFVLGGVVLASALVTENYVPGAAFGLVLVAYAVMLGPGQSLTARSFFRRTPMLRAPVEARVVPGVGVTTTTPGSTSQLDWSRVAGFRETDRVFVLQLDDARGGPFLVLAKRGLTDPDDVAVLRTILEHATGTAASPARPSDA